MPTVRTSAEVFADGSAIELVSPADGEELALLRWQGERASIASQIQHAGRMYIPIDLHASLRRAILLPSTVADYGAAGTFFQEVAGSFQEYVGVSALAASQVAFWNATTWFADCLPSPPPLAVSGPDLSQAIRLFRLIRCLCRRGVILAEISRSVLGWLPLDLRPTLLVAQPDLPPRIWAVACASNFRGAFLPGRKGEVLDAVCSKAIFTGMNGSSRWSDQTFHLALPPAPSDLPRLGDKEQESIARKYQPRFLMYRLSHLPAVRESRFADSRVKFPSSELARNLMLCLPDPELGQGLASVLQAQEQDRAKWRSWDPNLAIVEVLWLHLQDPQGDIGVSRLARVTNFLLFSRGARTEYSPEEIGWKLRQMGIPRHPGRDGMTVRFSRETCLRVHRLARDFGLNLPPHPDACPDCAKPQVVDG